MNTITLGTQTVETTPVKPSRIDLINQFVSKNNVDGKPYYHRNTIELGIEAMFFYPSMACRMKWQSIGENLHLMIRWYDADKLEALVIPLNKLSLT